ncbi:MAG TPA: CheR family methyltransferase [Paralcaligenes sp.]
MSLPASSLFTLPVLPEFGQGDFERAAHLLQRRTGIVLGDHKREMACRTLGIRTRKLGLSNVADYLIHLDQNAQSPEWDAFVNAFTINHTAFFRERHHFKALAELVQERNAPLSVWCSAASTGEEPYTIAMTLHEAGLPLPLTPPVWATDIDTKAIADARQGIYSLERVKPVPEDYLKKYFYRGRDRRAGMVRVKPNIRNSVRFETFNLLSDSWPLGDKFDVIFCRNTMIYFDKPTQTRILKRFASMLRPQGLLFAGHSENFTYLTDAFHLRGKTIYVRS